MGPRVTLDPERLIAADTQAVLDYLTAQLASKYPDLTSAAVKWSKVRRDLSKTINTAHMVYLNQRSAKKSNKDSSDSTSDDNNE